MCKRAKTRKFGLKHFGQNRNKGAHLIAISGDSYERFRELVDPLLSRLDEEKAAIRNVRLKGEKS